MPFRARGLKLPSRSELLQFSLQQDQFFLERAILFLESFIIFTPHAVPALSGQQFLPWGSPESIVSNVDGRPGTSITHKSGLKADARVRIARERAIHNRRFIFLWIAFDAAYATEIDDAYKDSEQATFKEFWQKLLRLDGKRCFDGLVWDEFSGSIRVLLDNPFVFYDFWSSHNGRLAQEEWKTRFAKANARARSALAQRQTDVVLSIVLARIYTLRNQLTHGGATWNSLVNRAQVRDCMNFLGKLVPLIIEVMMDNPTTLWGDACYPVVK
jgi:hypothetical protein